MTEGVGGTQPGAAAKRSKVRKEQVIKMSGLYREEHLGEGQSSPGLAKFRVGTEDC